MLDGRRFLGDTQLLFQDNRYHYDDFLYHTGVFKFENSFAFKFKKSTNFACAFREKETKGFM